MTSANIDDNQNQHSSITYSVVYLPVLPKLTHTLTATTQERYTRMTVTPKISFLVALFTTGLALEPSLSRRGMMIQTGAAGMATIFGQTQAAWGAAAVQDSMDVDSFLRSGQDIGGNMGVSSQAGKSRPETGVYLRDGSEVSRDPRSGNVLAEIILQKTDGSRMAALSSYSSPWPLGKCDLGYLLTSSFGVTDNIWSLCQFQPLGGSLTSNAGMEGQETEPFLPLRNL